MSFVVTGASGHLGRLVVEGLLEKVPAADYAAGAVAVLTGEGHEVGAGMPELYARIMADADASFAKGELGFTGGELCRLVGRPTTPIGDTVAAEVVDGLDHS